MARIHKYWTARKQRAGCVFPGLFFIKQLLRVQAQERRGGVRKLSIEQLRLARDRQRAHVALADPARVQRGRFVFGHYFAPADQVAQSVEEPIRPFSGAVDDIPVRRVVVHYPYRGRFAVAQHQVFRFQGVGARLRVQRHVDLRAAACRYLEGLAHRHCAARISRIFQSGRARVEPVCQRMRALGQVFGRKAYGVGRRGWHGSLRNGVEDKLAVACGAVYILARHRERRRIRRNHSGKIQNYRIGVVAYVIDRLGHAWVERAGRGDGIPRPRMVPPHQAILIIPYRYKLGRHGRERHPRIRIDQPGIRLQHPGFCVAVARDNDFFIKVILYA
ncbi:MAG: hypothetical protein KIPDCIKN_04118 [Haliscomenobacter sp.]|nr:hypothetical protein [Haliscomenobacter sp.]